MSSSPHVERLRELLSTQPEGEGAVILSEDDCLDALDDLRTLVEKYDALDDAIRDALDFLGLGKVGFAGRTLMAALDHHGAQGAPGPELMKALQDRDLDETDKP